MKGNVVRDFMIGETRIRICDDCCRDKTPEDAKEILAQITREALPSLRAKFERGAKRDGEGADNDPPAWGTKKAVAAGGG